MTSPAHCIELVIAKNSQFKRGSEERIAGLTAETVGWTTKQGGGRAVHHSPLRRGEGRSEFLRKHFSRLEPLNHQRQVGSLLPVGVFSGIFSPRTARWNVGLRHGSAWDRPRTLRRPWWATEHSGGLIRFSLSPSEGERENIRVRRKGHSHHEPKSRARYSARAAITS